MGGFRCPRLIHVPNGERESPLQAAQRIAPHAAQLAVQTERERALPPELLDELRDAGLFSLSLPRQLGGGEVEPAGMVLALEALARGDGASAWCAMVASTCGLLGAYLPHEQAELIFDGGHSIVVGVFAPRGRAERTEDGFLVSGRWPFVSGVGHSDWVLGGCLIASGDGVEMLSGGGPDVRLMLIPKADVQVIDTWSVVGLCGTGSHDMAVDRLLVPAGRSVSLFTDRPHLDGPLYAFPLFGLLALGICAVALGVARGAIDDLIELAAGKRPAPGARSLAERSPFRPRWLVPRRPSGPLGRWCSKRPETHGSLRPPAGSSPMTTGSASAWRPHMRHGSLPMLPVRCTRPGEAARSMTRALCNGAFATPTWPPST